MSRSKLFLTPDVRSVSIEVGASISQEDLCDYLAFISSATRLTSLSITSASRLPQTLPRLLQQQTTLEHVSLIAPGALSPSIGRWLSAIPSLTSLRIDVADRSDGVIASFFSGVPTSGSSSPGIATPDLTTSPASTTESAVFVNFTSEPGFKRLRHVSISGHLKSATSFLARIQAPLRSIELALEEPDDEKLWRPLWLTVSRQFKPTLRSFVISPSGETRIVDLMRSTTKGDNIARNLHFDGLENTEHSRLTFPLLTRFEIDLPESRLLSDLDVQYLAIACPNLETVKLCPLSRWPLSFGPPKTSLAGLALLMAGCERLHTLHMPIHAGRTDDDSLFDIETSSRSLSFLHLGHSWIDDPLSVAIHLSHFAPALETLKFFREKNRPGYVEAHCSGWQEVSDMLPLLQQVRLSERVHAEQLGYSRPRVDSRFTLYDAPSVKKSVSRGIQAQPTTSEACIQTKANVKHKGISTKPTPDTLFDVGVDATPRYVDQATTVEPVVESKGIETDAEPVRQTVDASTAPDPPLEEVEVPVDIEEPRNTSYYVSRPVVMAARILQAFMPPVFFHILSMLRIPGILGFGHRYPSHFARTLSPLVGMSRRTSSGSSCFF